MNGGEGLFVSTRYPIPEDGSLVSSAFSPIADTEDYVSYEFDRVQQNRFPFNTESKVMRSILFVLVSAGWAFAGQAQDYRTAALSFNPVVYYTCNGITNGVVENLIGGGPNGTCINNPNVSAAGIFSSETAPSAVEFTGTQYIKTMIDISEQELAVVFWFKTSNPTCGFFGVNRGASDYDRGLYLSNGDVYAYLYSGQTIHSSGRNFADGKWHQMVYTYGASIGGQFIYIDGKPVVSGNKTFSNFDWQDEIRFGQSNNAGYLTGLMDELFVANRALTPTEVESLYLPYIGTHVVSISPSGILDLTAGIWNFIDVEFSDTLNLSTFTPVDIQFVRQGTSIAVSSINLVSGSTYRILFPSQTQSGRYFLKIDGAGVLDVHGNPLDLNQNVVFGELEDVFTTAFMATTTPSLYSGLVGYWTCDEGQGSIANDLSNLKNNGIINGATWTSGIAGSALSYDGNDSINCGDDLSLTMTDQLTVAAWINPSSNYHGVIAGNEGQYLLALESDGTVIYALKLTSPSWTWIRTECPVPLNSWTHLALRFSSTEQTIQLFKNGVLAYAQNSVGTIGDNHPEYPNFMIGTRQGFPNESFRGIIDEVTVYNRPISAAEIHRLMSESAPCTPDLLYKTDNQTDYSGNNLYELTQQTLDQPVTTNMTAVYDIQIDNDSDAPCLISLSGPSSNTLWDIHYVDTISGQSIDAEVAGGGKQYSLTTNTAHLMVYITPKGAVQGNAVDCVLTAAQVQRPQNQDRITLRATFTANLPVPPYGKAFTTCQDFAQGQSNGVICESGADNGHLRLSEQATTLPFLWVPNSSDGTISKVNSVTGDELARYRVGPSNSDPSRTTVDLYGNCWVANRNAGTVVKVGLFENGQYLDRNLNGKVDTSSDLNGDGAISGSEILPFGADECVLLEVVVITGKEGAYAPGMYTGGYAGDTSCGPRGIAIDSYNNCWIGTRYSKQYYYLDGSTGQILKHFDFSGLNHRPYGAVIDENGTLWSAGENTDTLLWLDPTTDHYDLVALGHCVYGLGLDGGGHLFISGYDDRRLTRVNVNTKGIDWSVQGKYQSRGVAITGDGNVWVANSGENSVSRWTNDGQWITDIAVGNYPTGVSVDADGFVWAVNFTDQMIHRIDPATNAIVLSKLIAGNHYGYSDMTGIVSRSATNKIGTWKASINSGLFDVPWGAVRWTDSTPWGTDIDLYIRTSNDRIHWSQWEYVDIDKPLRFTPKGRYAEVQASFKSIVKDQSPFLYDLSVFPSPTCGDAEHLILEGDINGDCKVNMGDLTILAAQWLKG